MTIKARFRCDQISDHHFPSFRSEEPDNINREVKLSAVYSNDPSDPNKLFWEASPSGQMSITMTPKAGAYDSFKTGVVYELSFDPVAPGK